MCPRPERRATLVEGGSRTHDAVDDDLGPRRREAAQPGPAQQVEEDRLGAVVGGVRGRDRNTSVLSGQPVQDAVALVPRRRLAAAPDANPRPDERQPQAGGDGRNPRSLPAALARASQPVVDIGEERGPGAQRRGQSDRVGTAGKGQENSSSGQVAQARPKLPATVPLPA